MAFKSNSQHAEIIVCEDLGFDFTDVDLNGDLFNPNISVHYSDERENFSFNINDFCTWLEKTGRINDFIPAKFGESLGAVSYIYEHLILSHPDEYGYQDTHGCKTWVPFLNLHSEGFLTGENIQLFFEDMVDVENSPIQYDQDYSTKQAFCDFTDFIENYLTK